MTSIITRSAIKFIIPFFTPKTRITGIVSEIAKASDQGKGQIFSINKPEQELDKSHN